MTDGQDISAAVGNLFAMGSFAVMPGCTMYQYMGSSYTGDRWVIDLPKFKFKHSPKFLKVKSKINWDCQYNVTRITISAKLMSCSSRVTLYPGWEYVLVHI